MNIAALNKKSKMALDKFNNQSVVDVNDPSIKSIIKQLEFMVDCTSNGVAPKDALAEGQKLTFLILASRRLASPEELKLMSLIDDIAEEF